jgi:hypothetical protein
MKRMIAIVLLLAACSTDRPQATARPALVKEVPVAAAIAAFVPAPEPGTAVITFGVTYDRDTLDIAKPLTRFKRTFPDIAWRAQLSRGVTGPSVTWSVALRASSGHETTLFSVDEPLDGPGVTTLANSGDLAGLVGHKAGAYVMRYVDGREVLAEGTFTLVK